MVEDCGTAMRYLACRAGASEVMFSSAAAAGLAAGFASTFALLCV